jgi:DNA topoisomerase IA
MVERRTAPPPYLKEHELISLMDKYGIGTDASMAGHVDTIRQRKYVIICDENGTPMKDDDEA